MMEVCTVFWLQTTPHTRRALSQRSVKPCANCVDPSRPQQWVPDYRFLASRPCRPAGWLVILLIKAGDVETNPGPTITHKQVWMSDICHRQIQVRKQISIRCNRIEHWVHLRCAGIRPAQYTDTWTCHQHRESRLTTHRDPAVKVREISSYCNLQVNINRLKNKLEELKLLIHNTHAYIIITQETRLTLKSEHSKYITSQRCATIGCTRQEVGSSHLSETT